MAGDYGSMQSRVADELGGRSDLTSQIQLAIQTAIAKWERERFYFNSLNVPCAPGSPFNTVAGQEFYGVNDYALIPTIAHIIKAQLYLSNNRYTLNPRTSQQLADESFSTANQAMPVDYAYFAEQIRFYPIPNQAYPIGLLATQRLGTLSANADTNSWMTDAEALIRCEAKADLYDNTLQQPDLADRMQTLIHGKPNLPGHRGYLYDLKAETRRRIPESGRVRPSYF